MLKLTVYNYWRDANNYQQEKTHLFYKIIHFSVQFSAMVNRFIVKTLLNSTFTNDLKRKLKKSENVHSCRLSLFNWSDYTIIRNPTIHHKTRLMTLVVSVERQK